jgi:hypothetical protein
MVTIAALAWFLPPLMICIAVCHAQTDIIGVSPDDIFDAGSRTGSGHRRQSTLPAKCLHLPRHSHSMQRDADAIPRGIFLMPQTRDVPVERVDEIWRRASNHGAPQYVTRPTTNGAIGTINDKENI